METSDGELEGIRAEIAEVDGKVSDAFHPYLEYGHRFALLEDAIPTVEGVLRTLDKIDSQLGRDKGEVVDAYRRHARLLLEMFHEYRHITGA